MLVLAACLLGLLAPGAHAAEKGVVADITWGTSRAEVDRTIALMRQAGVRWVRANVSWSGGEPTRGRINEGWLAEVDYAVAAARRAGIEVLMPIADGVPYWASADPAKHVDGGGAPHWNVYYRPADAAAYGRFVRTVVARYRPQGVRAYEIWNEPNHARFWPSGPDPAAYAELLRAGHAAVKSVDPAATVVLGGLSRSDYAFLQQLYAAGAGPFFDAVAVHPYTATDPDHCWRAPASRRPSPDAFCAVDEVRRTMLRNGDGAKQVWLTEFGWSSSPLAPWSTDEARQASYLAKALRQIDERPWIARSFYYGLRNVFWLRDDPTDWEANLGLLRTDFSPKPAYEAFRRHTARVLRR